MLTYAQNFEDVMLARLFQGQSTGFYIDIGAWDPVDMSVTKHFYDLGWSGINVEPVRKQYDLFVARRQRDLNMCVAIADRKGMLRLHECADYTALSTADVTQAAMLARNGHTIRSYNVEALTLTDIAACCIGKSVDFIKIDVEGCEERIVRSTDWRTFRPRVLVIEATRPAAVLADWDSVEALRNWDAWEPALLTAGYLLAWYDGLNRFYLRDEDAYLARRFGLPPGIYDQLQFPQVDRLAQESEDTPQDRDRLVDGDCEALRNDRDRLARESEDLRNDRDRLVGDCEALRNDRDRLARESEDLRNDRDRSARESAEVRGDRDRRNDEIRKLDPCD